ncbi:MAG: tripartite tricarboxylate transporter TctB family protein [Rhodospirillales bacterium]
MTQTLRDAAVGGFVMACGALFLFQARMIDTDPDDPFGPKLAPTIIAGLTIGFGLLQVLVAMLRPGTADDAATQPFRPLLFCSVIGAGVAYIFLFQFVGYLISTLVVLTGMLLLFRNRFSGRLMVTAVLGALVYHVVFIELMNVHDPASLLSFRNILNWVG